MILSFGLPFFSAQDANWDARVDLEDAIINIRDLAATANNPEAFLPRAGKAISTLQVVAGVKAQISPEKNDKSSGPFMGINPVYLIPSIVNFPPTEEFPVSIELSFPYQSIFISPDTPPPRSV